VAHAALPAFQVGRAQDQQRGLVVHLDARAFVQIKGVLHEPLVHAGKFRGPAHLVRPWPAEVDPTAAAAMVQRRILVGFLYVQHACSSCAPRGAFGRFGNIAAPRRGVAASV